MISNRYFNSDDVACMVKNSSNEEDCEDSSDTDLEDNVEERKEDSETEQEDVSHEETDEDDTVAGVNYFVGKDKTTKWYHNPLLTSSRARPQNLIRHLLGQIGDVMAKSVAECWACFFTDDILETVVTCTNQYINFVKDNYARNWNAKCTDVIELKAFIGLLYLAGAYRANRQFVGTLGNRRRSSGAFRFGHEHQKIQIPFALHAV